jgi:hypothetical protein
LWTQEFQQGAASQLSVAYDRSYFNVDFDERTVATSTRVLNLEIHLELQISNQDNR